MWRREFIKLSFAAAASPFAVQPGKPALAAELPRIMILHSGFPHRTPIHLLIEALAKLGYENSRTAKIELLGGEGDPGRLNGLVAEISSHTFCRGARLDISKLSLVRCSISSSVMASP